MNRRNMTRLSSISVVIYMLFVGFSEASAKSFGGVEVRCDFADNAKKITAPLIGSAIGVIYSPVYRGLIFVLGVGLVLLAWTKMGASVMRGLLFTLGAGIAFLMLPGVAETVFPVYCK